MNTRTAVATVALAALNLTAVALQSTSDVALFEGGQLLIASAGSGAVAAFDEGGGALPQPVTGLLAPEDLAFAPDGSLYVSDGDRVLVTDAGGAVLDSLGSGSGLSDATGLAFGPDGALYVSSSGSDSVLVFDRDGALVDEVGAFDGLHQPWGLAFGPDGRLHVASTGGDEVLVFDPSGALVAFHDAGGALQEPLGLCFDGTGLLWISSSGNDRVLALDAAGDVVHDFDGGELLSAPAGLAFGPDGLLYVSSSGNDRVLAFDGTGAVVRVLGSDGSALAPRGLAFAPWLFKATLKGSLSRPAEKPVNFSEKALVTLQPGRPGMSVRLLDPEGVLAGAWESDTWLLHGLLAQESALDTTRVFGGEQVGGGAAHAGLLTLQAQLRGKLQLLKSAPALPARWVPRSANGSFLRSGPQGLASGKLKTGALQKP